jgi:hypothetical protein
LILQFVKVDFSATIIPSLATPIPFTVIGTDQGLTNKPRDMTTLVVEPGAQYNIIFDFSPYSMSRVVLRNLGDNLPFGGIYGEEGVSTHEGYAFNRTDCIMAFDVTVPFSNGASPPFPLFDKVYFKLSFLSHQQPILHIFARWVCLKDVIITIESCHCLAQLDLLRIH